MQLVQAAGKARMADFKADSGRASVPADRIVAFLTEADIEAGFDGKPLTRSITSRVQEKSTLLYGGVSIDEFKGKRAELAMCHILLGRAPSPEEQDSFDRQVHEHHAPENLLAQISLMDPTQDPMALLQALIAQLPHPEFTTWNRDGLSDDLFARAVYLDGLSIIRPQIELLAAVHRMCMGWGQPVRECPSGDDNFDLGKVFVFKLGIFNDPSDREKFERLALFVNACLTGWLAHGEANAGSFAAFVAAATQTPANQIGLAGSAALFGKRHGRASTDVAVQFINTYNRVFGGKLPSEEQFSHFLDVFLNGAEREAWVPEWVTKGKLAGFGHRVYEHEDSRLRLYDHLIEQFALSDDPLITMVNWARKMVPEKLAHKLASRFANTDSLPAFLGLRLGLFGEDTTNILDEHPEIFGTMTALFYSTRNWAYTVAASLYNPRLIRPRAIADNIPAPQDEFVNSSA
ncbi:MAG: hypothetical protein KDD64_01675 [Bdellovibrionales bacterium]|nr:hypothetical protein [Bdellovibrionales bacterium]